METFRHTSVTQWSLRTQRPLQNSGEGIKPTPTAGRSLRPHAAEIGKQLGNAGDRRSEARGTRRRRERTYGDERGAELAQGVQRDGAASAIAPQFHGPALLCAPGCTWMRALGASACALRRSSLRARQGLWRSRSSPRCRGRDSEGEYLAEVLVSRVAPRKEDWESLPGLEPHS
jgi:hypothetical protein